MAMKCRLYEVLGYDILNMVLFTGILVLDITYLIWHMYFLDPESDSYPIQYFVIDQVYYSQPCFFQIFVLFFIIRVNKVRRRIQKQLYLIKYPSLKSNNFVTFWQRREI